jgi:hypothetical protein
VITSVVGLLEQTPEAEGRVVGAFANDLPCWIVPVPDRMVDFYLGLAEWWRRDHHDGGTAVAKQIIVCDPASVFRGIRGCQTCYRSGQSLLLPADHSARAEHHRTEQPGGASAIG